MESIRKKYNLILILMHGSNVTNKTHEKSDIDIAIVRRDVKTDLNLIGLIQDLSVFFKSDKIDLTDITHANPLLLYAVMTKSKLLAGKDDDYEKYLKIAFDRYSDYKPYFDMERKFLISRLNQYA